MSFPKLTFPIIVDFSGDQYWIEKGGPYKYGEAVTAFFIGEDIADVANDGIPLMRELEVYLKTFGNYLHPYARAEEASEEMFRQLERSSAGCTVNYAFHPMDGAVAVEARPDTVSALLQERLSGPVGRRGHEQFLKRRSRARIPGNFINGHIKNTMPVT